MQGNTEKAKGGEGKACRRQAEAEAYTAGPAPSSDQGEVGSGHPPGRSNVASVSTCHRRAQQHKRWLRDDMQNAAKHAAHCQIPFWHHGQPSRRTRQTWCSHRKGHDHQLMQPPRGAGGGTRQVVQSLRVQCPTVDTAAVAGDMSDSWHSHRNGQANSWCSQGSTPNSWCSHRGACPNVLCNDRKGRPHSWCKYRRNTANGWDSQRRESTQVSGPQLASRDEDPRDNASLPDLSSSGNRGPNQGLRQFRSPRIQTYLASAAATGLARGRVVAAPGIARTLAAVGIPTLA